MKSKFSPYMLGRDKKQKTATGLMQDVYYYGVRGKEMKSLRKGRRKKMYYGYGYWAIIFPSVMIVLDVCASGVWFWCGNVRMGVYWLAAAVLTFCVTF